MGLYKLIMKVGITGSSGLIGSRFIEKFGRLYDFLEFKGDMTNFESVNNFMNQSFEILIHLASIIPKYHQYGIPTNQSFSSNIIGTENFAKLASEYNKKIIFTSTQCVYDLSNNHRIQENDNLNPNTPYGKSKLESEKILNQLLNTAQLTILRISSVYGTFPIRPSIIDSIAESFICNKKMKIGLNPKVLRDYIYLDDLLDILNLSINHSGIFNVCLGKSYNVRDIVKFFETLSGKKNKIIHGNYTTCNIELDNTKMLQEMKFNPIFNIKTGIKKVYSDIQKFHTI